MSKTKLRPRPKWLDDSLIKSKQYMYLALNEEEYLDIFHSDGVDHHIPRWCKPGCANCTFFENKNGASTVIVAIDPELGDGTRLDNIKIVAMLAHEAVHVFQKECEMIGEDKPSDEFEAYSIQRILDTLLRAYVEKAL